MRTFGRDGSKTMQYKLLKFALTTAACFCALILASPVSADGGTGLGSVGVSTSTNGEKCELGYALGGFSGGAGTDWIPYGTDGSIARWGDHDGDGETGDLQIETSSGRTITLLWQAVYICEVIDCSNPAGNGDDDGGDTCVPGTPGCDDGGNPCVPGSPGCDDDGNPCVPGSPGCDDDGEPCEPGSPGCDDDGEPCEPGTPGCNEDDESCEPGSPGCETAGNSGGNPGIASGGPPDSPPGCTNRRLTEYGMECQLTCPAYPVTGGGVACLDVIRQPYPRGMVTVPNYYTLNGPWINQGAVASCPDPDVEFPMVTNSSVRIDFRLRQDTPPAWRFDERPWNIVNHDATNEAYGTLVEHTYDTSSFSTFEGDKPYNGPSLTEELLSSYQVQVFTWWDGFVITRWDSWGWDYSYETREVCDEFGVCSEQEFEVSREYVYRGPQKNTEQVDLRTLGYPSSSMFSDLAWDSRQEPIFPYHCRVIPTPIIEVQSILVGP